MITIEINKTKVFISIFISIFISYFIVGFIYRTNFKTKYKYSIATLTKVEYMGRSTTNRAMFTYNYNSEINIGRYNFENDSSSYYESQVGNEFLVKMSDKPWVNRIFFTYKLYINKPVPDSIKEAPLEGWKELPTWAK